MNQEQTLEFSQDFEQFAALFPTMSANTLLTMWDDMQSVQRDIEAVRNRVDFVIEVLTKRDLDLR